MYSITSFFSYICHAIISKGRSSVFQCSSEQALSLGKLSSIYWKVFSMKWLHQGIQPLSHSFFPDFLLVLIFEEYVHVHPHFLVPTQLSIYEVIKDFVLFSVLHCSFSRFIFSIIFLHSLLFCVFIIQN